MASELQTGRDQSASATATVPTRSFDGLVEQAIDRAKSWLLGAQFPGGYWSGELEADTTLESDYILYHHAVGKLDSPKIPKLANYIRLRQLPNGGWNIYPGGPAELNATVKAYFALKLTGDDPNLPHMQRARARALELGGLELTNSYTRFYLALVGAVEWDVAPAIPPELILLPHWFFINIYEMSSWTRAILVPLSMLYAAKPAWHVPEHARLPELFRDPQHKRRAFKWDRHVFSWRNFFLAADRLMKFHERLPWKPLRKRALTRVTAWVYAHLERSEGLAAIFPSMANSIFCLQHLGYPADHPLVKQQVAYFSAHEIEEGDTIRMQPCVSPVWDTAIALVALEEAGLNSAHPALVNAARWILDLQITDGGDWQVKNKDADPGGWAFEFRNDHYPDVDDTAFVLMALARVAYPDPERMERAFRRGLNWLLSMQNRDGGWGAFDRDNDLTLLNHIPFADHNAMLDPSTADVTARALECIGKQGFPTDHPAVEKAREFLRKDQTPEGAWFGRWGVNYVYGTSGVLRALETFGLSNSAECRRAASWLRSVQNPDGGFGESVISYTDPSRKGQGSSTASQTAWGLIGLLAVSGPDDPAAIGAVKYLFETQNVDGSWDEDAYTGTGFPCVFYLKYHLYRNSFPLYALARYRNMKNQSTEFSAFRLGPQGFKHRKLDRGKE